MEYRERHVQLDAAVLHTFRSKAVPAVESKLGDYLIKHCNAVGAEATVKVLPALPDCEESAKLLEQTKTRKFDRTCSHYGGLIHHLNAKLAEVSLIHDHPSTLLKPTHQAAVESHASLVSTHGVVTA